MRNGMKKAWPHIKCVLFIVVLAVVILVCDYLFAESGYIRFVLNDVNSSNESYDTIVLGASHTRCSIDTEYLDKYMNVNSFNMGIPGETVDDFYYVLKSVVDSGNNVKQVIVDVDYYYWMNGQSQNHFSKSFIYQQMKDTWVKAEYLWNNRAELDIRKKYGVNIMAIKHNDITKVFGDGAKSKLKLKIDKKIYSKFEKIVFVSNDNKAKFNNLFRGMENKQEVIYNYISKSRVLELATKEVGQEYIDKNVPSIITVARLVKQKAIDRLIRVHKKLIDDGIKHNVYVIGDGPEKENLKKLIKELKVEDTFLLMGKRENPYPYVKRADYFVLLSEFEGYGMVIDEAKFLNKNIIITKTAAEEAVKGYSKKLILENSEEAIYEGLKQVLKKNIMFEEKNQNFDDSFLIEKIENLLEY